MLFLNVGWMKHYTGENVDDRTLGNHKFLKDHDFGDEAYNFVDVNGRCYGSHPSSRGTNLHKLGGPRGAESLNSVDVIWFSKNPDTRSACIVGWYRNATVYSKMQEPLTGEGNRLNGKAIRFKVKARHSDCTLLEIYERSFPVLDRKDGGYGQNVNWYGKDEFFRGTVERYLGDRESKVKLLPSERFFKPSRNPDLAQRQLIEAIAIEAATTFYASVEGGARRVRSVERENKGWDLEASGEVDTLYVEVKGLSGSSATVELTPNEYEKMQRYKLTWQLFIVTNCLSEHRRKLIIRYDVATASWRTAEERPVVVIPRPGAVIRVND